MRLRLNRLKYEHQIQLTALFIGLPGSLTALVLLWIGNYSSKVQWTFSTIIIVSWICFTYALHNKVVFPLRTVSILLAALHEGDYSIRAFLKRKDDALGEVLVEVNTLSEILQSQRIGALEAAALLQRVMSEIDAAVFAFDDHRYVRLVNRAGEQFLQMPAEKIIGTSADLLGLGICLVGQASRTFEQEFPGRKGRWGMRRSRFRENGVPHYLLVISDLSKALREEERQAWKKLIRVLGHELNNSLAPIKSIAGSMSEILIQENKPDDWQDDLTDGLQIISSRAEALARFMAAYSHLAKLPLPRFKPLKIHDLINHVLRMDERLPIKVNIGPDIAIDADKDQMEQMLINLLRNAVDASVEMNGSVEIGWREVGHQVVIQIDDEGPGLADTKNLFVPFFTTKKNGTGIGLVLSRQIAEAHDGTLTLTNRQVGGCRAELILPIFH